MQGSDERLIQLQKRFSTSKYNIALLWSSRGTSPGALNCSSKFFSCCKFAAAYAIAPYKIGIAKLANELKLVVPQAGHTSLESLMARFEKMDYRNRFLQPMDGANLKSNTELAVSLCQKRPLWRLSIQSHKLIGIR